MDEHRNRDDGLHCISACFLLISCDTFSDQTNDTLSSFFIIFWFLLSLSLSVGILVYKSAFHIASFIVNRRRRNGSFGDRTENL